MYYIIHDRICFTNPESYQGMNTHLMICEADLLSQFCLSYCRCSEPMSPVCCVEMLYIFELVQSDRTIFLLVFVFIANNKRIISNAIHICTIFILTALHVIQRMKEGISVTNTVIQAILIARSITLELY